jgi:hydroxyethylthiazole kinase
LIDDDADSDSHCQSPTIRSLLRLDDGTLVSDQVDAVTIALSPTYASLSEEDKLKLSERYKSESDRNGIALKSLAAQNQIKRFICKFPSEWCKDDFDTRYGWLRKVSPDGPLSEADYNRLREHHQTLAFWEDAALADIDNKHWHFPPKEFISAFKKCGWISKEELHTILKQAPAQGKLRAEGLRVQMNKMLTKYLINSSRIRTAHFFAQVGIETGWWRHRQEFGGENYFRTMYEIITPTEAGVEYDRAVAQQKNLPNGLRPEEFPNPDPRKNTTRASYIVDRPVQIAEKAARMDNGAANSVKGGQTGDGERFRGRGFLQITGRRNYTNYQKYRKINFTADQNPLLLASSDYNACDASGFYWAREKINRYADEGDTSETSKKIGSIINRGSPDKEPNHNTERQAAFIEIWQKINEKN